MMGTDRDQERNEIFSIKEKNIAQSSLAFCLRGDEQLVRFRSTSKHHKSFSAFIVFFEGVRADEILNCTLLKNRSTD